MAHKVDISEVIEFSDDLNSAAAEIKKNLELVEKKIDKLTGMQSFSGKTANEAKNYFNDLHKTLLKTFDVLFTDLDEYVKQHVRAFGYRVDSSDSAIIEKNYLMDTEANVNDDYDRLTEEQESIREIIASVSDISSASQPITMTVSSKHRSTIKVITDLDRDLDSYTSAGRREISETEEILHHLDIAIQNAGATSGSARFTNYAGNSKSVGLARLQEIHNERHEAIVAEARKAKEAALKDVKYSASKEVIHLAFKEFADGKIDEETFYTILSSVKQTDGRGDIEKLQGNDYTVLIEYLEKHQMLEDYAASNKSFAEYIIVNWANWKKLGWEATPTALSAFIEKVGLTMEDIAKYLGREPVPLTKASQDLLHKAGQVLKYGKAIGPAFMVAGFAYGMYEDAIKGDKTVGQAVAHNGSSILAGLGGAAVVASFVTPVGWGAAAIAAGGVITTMGFEYLYEKNFLGIQDGLDWVGEKLDWVGAQLNNGIEAFNSWVNDAANAVGEAISGALDWLNPFSR